MDDEHLTEDLGNRGHKANSISNLNGSKRMITEMHPGQHKAIIPLKMWQENQQRRQQRGTMPITTDRRVREYLLTGVGFCWECFEWDRRQAGLRGVMGSRNPYYRCATVQDEYKVRRKRRDENRLESLSTIGLQMHEDETIDSLIERHQSSLPKEILENQITDQVTRLKIPEGWYETILAYYLDDVGMVRFELGGYNLRKELSRQRELFRLGHITQVEYEQAVHRIERELHRMKPSTQSDARQIAPLLKDFLAIWSQMNLTERRAILKTIYVGIYFDSGSSLRKALLKSPFDKLLEN
jgi:hypothetical protein